MAYLLLQTPKQNLAAPLTPARLLIERSQKWVRCTTEVNNFWISEKNQWHKKVNVNKHSVFLHITVENYEKSHQNYNEKIEIGRIL